MINLRINLRGRSTIGSNVIWPSLQEPLLDLVSETEFTLRKPLYSVRRPGRAFVEKSVVVLC